MQATPRLFRFAVASAWMLVAACAAWASSPTNTVAIPEPTTMTLLAIGVFSVVGYAWLRSKPR